MVSGLGVRKPFKELKEVIALADSQILRSIRDIRKRTVKYSKLEKLFKESISRLTRVNDYYGINRITSKFCYFGELYIRFLLNNNSTVTLFNDQQLSIVASFVIDFFSRFTDDNLLTYVASNISNEKFNSLLNGNLTTM